ncbi:hypothetical protein LAG90_16225 [Marinilongibacter aquaticus]|uniref:hypothetical protein n=1 Tax=Marinilongibacter aquaticus TaxID=2975157 RepID=UPI0021BD39E3|nr:hypothetical protein [Marinilongibacter aquaticus]UBM58351.1 hypothetical protein LAG90_16225 [Marinilongibacter aquaticus]
MPNVTIAVDEQSVQEIFQNVVQSFHVVKSGSSNGNFRASYNAGIRLSGGDLDLKDPNNVKISELDIIYDPLNVTLEVDIPQMCIGGFCIIPKPWPWSGCLVRAPRICLFSANPDISLPINLDGIIQSEISGSFRPEIKYFDNPLNATLNDFQAYAQDKMDEWRLHLKADWVDIDIIDIADTLGNILDNMIDHFINNIFGGLPGWAKDILGWLLHGMVDIVRDILDIADDIDEWLSDLLGVSFGLFDFIAVEVGNYLSDKFPLIGIPNPYPIIPGSNPVLLTVSNVNVNIDETEMALTVSI